MINHVDAEEWENNDAIATDSHRSFNLTKFDSWRTKSMRNILTSENVTNSDYADALA